MRQTYATRFAAVPPTGSGRVIVVWQSHTAVAVNVDAHLVAYGTSVPERRESFANDSATPVDLG